MPASLHVFPIERHSYLVTIARRIVEEHPEEERDMAIVREGHAFRKRQCRRFPQAVAHQQFLNMLGGLAEHVGEIEGQQVDAA